MWESVLSLLIIVAFYVVTSFDGNLSLFLSFFFVKLKNFLLFFLNILEQLRTISVTKKIKEFNFISGLEIVHRCTRLFRLLYH